MSAILHQHLLLPASILPEGAQSLEGIATLVQRYLGCEAVAIVADNLDTSPGLAASPPAAAAFRKGSRLADRALCDVPALANPLHAGALGMRFFAGLPLHDHEGRTVGTLAAMDRQERALSPEDLATLRLFADLATDLTKLQLLCQAA